MTRSFQCFNANFVGFTRLFNSRFSNESFRNLLCLSSCLLAPNALPMKCLSNCFCRPNQNVRDSQPAGGTQVVKSERAENTGQIEARDLLHVRKEDVKKGTMDPQQEGDTHPPMNPARMRPRALLNPPLFRRRRTIIVPLSGAFRGKISD